MDQFKINYQSTHKASPGSIHLIDGINAEGTRNILVRYGQNRRQLWEMFYPNKYVVTWFTTDNILLFSLYLINIIWTSSASIPSNKQLPCVLLP